MTASVNRSGISSIDEEGALMQVDILIHIFLISDITGEVSDGVTMAYQRLIDCKLSHA